MKQRNQFALAIMVGLVSNPEITKRNLPDEELAGIAVRKADRLIDAIGTFEANDNKFSSTSVDPELIKRVAALFEPSATEYMTNNEIKLFLQLPDMRSAARAFVMLGHKRGVKKVLGLTQRVFYVKVKVQ